MRAAGGLLALLLFSAAALAEPSKEQLRQLEGAIQRTEKELQGKRAERGDAEQRLREAEQAIAQLEREIEQVGARAEAQKRRLAELQRERAGLEGARQRQEAGIAEQMRLAYQLGRQPKLRLLMRQDEPERLSRGMNYLERLNRERLAVLAQYQATLDGLARLEPAIAREGLALEQSRQQLQQRSGELKGRQAERQQALAELDARIRDQDAELKKMVADRQQLEQLLAAIAERQRQAAERAAREAREREAREREARARKGGETQVERERGERVSSDFGAAAGKSFAGARGRLPWPVAGSLVNFFGDPRAGGALRWQGVTIRAAEGSPVRAVHGGTVVFADVFRGAGQLVVVDHGGGYMSLYAHNSALASKVGAQVSAGQVIASVGSTGAGGAGLYFEIRYNGEPQDPRKWCQGRG